MTSVYVCAVTFAYPDPPPPNGVPTAYTDGSSFFNGRHYSRAGYGVFWGDNHPNNVSERLRNGPATSNRAELAAVATAISQGIKSGLKAMVIYTDSRYAINCCDVWINEWKAYNWTTLQGQPVANRDIIIEIDRMRREIHVEFKHIFAHRGYHGNMMADKLAKQGANRD